MDLLTAKHRRSYTQDHPYMPDIGKSQNATTLCHFALDAKLKITIKTLYEIKL